jgi:nucleoid DNA-binding protein
MTKKEIVKYISDETGLTQLDVKKVVQMTFDSIIETLSSDGRIELRKFGVFEVKLRKARRARNPRTNQPVDVEAKNVVTFQPGKDMEEKVRDTKPIGGPRPQAIDDDEDDDTFENEKLPIEQPIMPSVPPVPTSTSTYIG